MLDLVPAECFFALLLKNGMGFVEVEQFSTRSLRPISCLVWWASLSNPEGWSLCQISIEKQFLTVSGTNGHLTGLSSSFAVDCFAGLLET